MKMLYCIYMWNGIKSPVCYLSSEFGIDNDLPTYAGGLGVLAADVISSAADEDYPFVGIGILYKGKEFIQHITAEGRMETRDSDFDHDTSFLRQTSVNGKPVTISLIPGSSNVVAKAYHLRLSEKTVLFFLSTDVDTNPPEWVSDMDTLYKGDTESQIRQQILLGIGAVKLMEALSISPKIYHFNEGRPSFAIWEIVNQVMENEKVDFPTAWIRAKERIVYTNHTLVAAGNLTYPVEPLKKWAAIFAQRFGVDPIKMYEHGVTEDNVFSITQFALNVSSKQSAVSTTHADNAKVTWPNYNWIPITNGIHMPRWQDSDFRRNLSDRELWELHLVKKKELMNTVVERTGVGYDTNKMVITWAKRLAEYKQPKIIFSDIQKLKAILNKTDRQAQLIFAGNSHTFDPQSKPIIEDVINLFRTELSGSAIFVPNYNISLSNRLTSGSDIWLNTPQGNLEACGTSGMKAAANGVVNMTVLDGWTYEVDWKDNGFVLDSKRVASSFYETLENIAIPMYYKRNSDNIPEEFLTMMRNSIKMSEKFSCKRVLGNYKTLLYEDPKTTNKTQV